MTYLILSIVSTTLVFVIFKLFSKFKINNLKAIITNYFTAHFIGTLHAGGYNPVEVFNSNWIWVALILGGLFISLFNLMALTAQKNGVSVASVANKMSVVIPVFIAIAIFGENASLIKGLGIALACIGVWLTSSKASTGSRSNNLLFPIVLFLGSGILDAIFVYATKELLSGNENLFSAMIFLFAGLMGVSYLIVKKDFRFKLKDILWGIVLGSINYFSIYFVLKALTNSPWESSVVFPINNMAIVGVSSVVSLLLFKEKLSLKNWGGILVSILAIVIITWS